MLTFCTLVGTCRSQQPHGEGVPGQQKRGRCLTFDFLGS